MQSAGAGGDVLCRGSFPRLVEHLCLSAGVRLELLTTGSAGLGRCDVGPLCGTCAVMWADGCAISGVETAESDRSIAARCIITAHRAFKRVLKPRGPELIRGSHLCSNTAALSLQSALSLCVCLSVGPSVCPRLYYALMPMQNLMGAIKI